MDGAFLACQNESSGRAIVVTLASVLASGLDVLVVCNPRVAQQYGTMAPHTRHRGSVLVMFVVCLCACVQFCWFDKADA